MPAKSKKVVPDHEKRIETAIVLSKILGIKPKRQQPNRKRGKALVMVNEENPLRCVLCEETRCLERAHIIPVYLYEHLHIDGKLPDIFHQALWMCPTHHKCYDKYRLTDKEKAHMKWLLSHDYIEAIESALSCIEVSKPLNFNSQRLIDDITNRIWYWWKEYAHAN